MNNNGAIIVIVCAHTLTLAQADLTLLALGYTIAHVFQVEYYLQLSMLISCRPLACNMCCSYVLLITFYTDTVVGLLVTATVLVLDEFG